MVVYLSEDDAKGFLRELSLLTRKYKVELHVRMDELTTINVDRNATLDPDKGGYCAELIDGELWSVCWGPEAPVEGDLYIDYIDDGDEDDEDE